MRDFDVSQETDDLAAARGILTALPISFLLWGFILGVMFGWAL